MTNPGLERTLKLEIDEKVLSNPLNLGCFALVKTSSLEDLVRIALSSRIASRVLIPVIIEEVEDPHDISTVLAKVREHRDVFREFLEEIIDRERDRIAFRGLRLASRNPLRGTKTYMHNFSSVDLARESARILLDPSIKVDLKKPTIEILVAIIGDILILAWDLFGDLNKKRAWRKNIHSAALRPTAASAAFYMAYSRKMGAVIYDPMCGYGTIPLEILSILEQFPIGIDLGREKVKDFVRRILGDFGEETRILAKRSKKFHDKYEILGSDISQKNIALAVDNLQTYRSFLKREWGIEPRRFVKFFSADILFSDPPHADMIITNPPFGIRSARPGAIKKLYKALSEYSYKSGAEIFVCFTPHDEVMISVSREHWEVKSVSNILLGDLKVKLIIMERK